MLKKITIIGMFIIGSTLTSYAGTQTCVQINTSCGLGSGTYCCDECGMQYFLTLAIFLEEYFCSE